jgi:4-hydroxy-tetrahydrodipicolinate synthase
MTAADRVRGRLAGCIAPIVTPFDAAGELSLHGLAAVLDFLAAQRVTGIVPGDLVGEYPALSLEERRQLIEGTVKLGRGRFVVVALVSHPSAQTAIALARFAERAGADAVKIALPYTYVPADAMILEYVRRTSGAVGLPFMVESSDEMQIPLPVIAALCDDPRFVGVEEMGSDLGRLQRLNREFGSRLALLPAGEAALLVLCLLGAPGCIAAENNFAPAFMRDFLDACQRRDLDLALTLFDRRTQYRDLFRAGLARASFTPWAKAALELLGLPVGNPRPPHEPLDAVELSNLRTALKEQFGLVPTA